MTGIHCSKELTETPFSCTATQRLGWPQPDNFRLGRYVGVIADFEPELSRS